ncbi:hypothetical protein BH23BAC4_BH23BAC4_13130 [soil metagenome]
MDIITLSAETRATGKSATKAVRREGAVPCVLYGRHQEPIHFRVPVLALRGLIYTAETHRVSVELGGDAYDCIVKNVTFDPITDVPSHVDFIALTAGEVIQLDVPVQLIGDAPGVLGGGELIQQLNSISVECLPKDMPSHVEADISGLEIGSSLHVSDLSLPDVTILTDGARTVVSVVAPRVEEEPETDVEALLAEGDEALEGEEGEGETDGEGQGDEPKTEG